MRFLALAVFAAASAAGCGAEPVDGRPPGRSATHEHAAATHEHHAPHGGALVVLGDEAAHVEIVLDAAAGRVTAYVLDGEAERGVRIAQGDIALDVTAPGAPARRLVLAAVANPLTGEVVGDTSEFRGQDAAVAALPAFAARLGPVTVKGVRYDDVSFRFPGGNEEDAR